MENLLFGFGMELNNIDKLVHHFDLLSGCQLSIFDQNEIIIELPKALLDISNKCCHKQAKSNGQN